MTSWIRQWGAAIVDMLWPRVCQVCGQTLVDGERTLCISCQLNMPVTSIHRQPFNSIHQRLAATGVPIEKAAAYFHYYTDNPYSRLLIDAKYNHQPWIDRDLARCFAGSLRAEGWFEGIDAIMPVPMHPWKRLRRGYNQAEVIARGIADIAGLPVMDNLVCVRHHGTQTHLGRTGRWVNAMRTYAVERPDELDHLHLLIVDDIITSGATMLACCTAILCANPTVRLSALSLGLTHSH